MNRRNEQKHSSAPETPLSWEWNHQELRFRGDLTLPWVDDAVEPLFRELKHFSPSQLVIVLDEVKRLDSAGVALLQRIATVLEEKGKTVLFASVPRTIAPTLKMFTLERSRERTPPARLFWIERLGEAVDRFFRIDLIRFVYLMADIFYWSFADLFTHRQRRKGEFVNQVVLMGANAVPIVSTIALLIGLVVALQSAAQLRQFGANVYVADLIAISMVQEMGPLLTAIVVAGRSGSAIASEIGTMVITEEVDALKTMAISPVRYLIIPKVHALVLSLPLLAMLANFLGILGGTIVGYFYLNISPYVFYNRMVQVLEFRDLMTGFVKSLVFAGLIVITGSFYGFRVQGGPEGVGRVTTASVVTAIFLVILADSFLGLLFY